MSLDGGWGGFAAYQVFGDHVPMDGFRLVVRARVDADELLATLERRATRAEMLDPELGRRLVRAALGTLQTGHVAFAYVSGGHAAFLIEEQAVRELGESMVVHDRVISNYSARLALLVGGVLPVVGEVYEFPNVDVARKAIVALHDSLEEATPSRSARWLGAQLRGRGEPFHPSMIETLEEQMAILVGYGLNLDELPHWWWRGAAGRVRGGEIELFEDLPDGDRFGALIV